MKPGQLKHSAASMPAHINPVCFKPLSGSLRRLAHYLNSYWLSIL